MLSSRFSQSQLQRPTPPFSCFWWVFSCNYMYQPFVELQLCHLPSGWELCCCWLQARAGGSDHAWPCGLTWNCWGCSWAAAGPTASHIATEWAHQSLDWWQPVWCSPHGRMTLGHVCSTVCACSVVMDIDLIPCLFITLILQHLFIYGTK